VSEAIQQIKAGKLRALAVTTATRLDVFPDVPPPADCVPGYEANGFAGLADPKIKTRIVELGGTVVGPQARLRPMRMTTALIHHVAAVG
jgi:hypothetical protein